MKSIRIFAIIACFFFTKVYAQSPIDTISLLDFKMMSFKEMKLVFHNDSPALKLIKSTQQMRWLALGAIPLAFTPLAYYTVPGGISLYLSCSKKRLYKSVIIKSVNTTNSFPALVPKNTAPKNSKTDSLPVFDISLEQFKKLSKKQQDSMFVYDYTTQCIFDYTYGYQIPKYVLGTITLGCFVGTGFLFNTATEIGKSSSTSRDLEAIIFNTFGVATSAVGFAFTHFTIDAFQRGSQQTLYNNLLKYYSSHNVTAPMAKYIKSRKKHDSNENSKIKY